MSNKYLIFIILQIVTIKFYRTMEKRAQKSVLNKELVPLDRFLNIAQYYQTTDKVL